MANVYDSTEYGNRVAVPPKQNPKNKFGKVYRAYFSLTSPAAGGAADDEFNLVVLPAGARVVGGRLTHEAMTGGTQELSIGYTGAVDQFLVATALGTSEGDLPFASVLSDGFGDELSSETTIKAYSTVAALTAAKAIAGYVEFIF